MLHAALAIFFALALLAALTTGAVMIWRERQAILDSIAGIRRPNLRDRDGREI